MQKSELLSLTSGFLTRIDRLKKDDILALREAIREHNRLYYEEESPIISDVEYDALFHALARLEADNNMIDEDSPTARLAILASEQFQKVKHLYPMISLDNTYNVEEVREWNERMLRILDAKFKMQNSKGTNQKSGILNLESGILSYYVQPKYDGLGLALIYEYGKLTQAITRGSGVEGEDVTLGAWEIKNIPKEIKELNDIKRMEVRGEVMMSRTTFKAVNHERLETGEKLFANPRNAASGSLRQLDPLITRSRNLEFFAYSIPSIEQSKLPFEGEIPKGQRGSVSEIEQTPLPPFQGGFTGTYHSLMNLLYAWGFERAEFPFTLIQGIDNLCNLIQEETNKHLGIRKTPLGRGEDSSVSVMSSGGSVSKNSKKESSDIKNPPESPLPRGVEPGYFDFDIDGMVLKLNDMTLWDELGTTEHHPRYAIAYKFPAKQVRTRVVSIEHSVGRTGTVTPVANLEPVEVTGVIVKRATLHNYDELTKKGVREGDYVYVIRAGEVIPEIVSVIADVRTGEEREVHPPENCPICQTKLEQDEGKVAIFCPNRHCPAQIQGRLEVFVGKQGLNIDGFGTKQIELFLKLGWITDFASIFHLHEYREQFFELEGYKEKSVNNLIESIEKSRNTTLERAIVSLGIPNIGKKTAKLIAAVITKKILSHETLPLIGGDGGGTPPNLPYKGRNNTIHTLFSLTEDELFEIKDIGPETAHSLIEYMEDNREIVERLFAELDFSESTNKPMIQQSSSLSGKSFCVTGSFDGISRDEIHELIEKNGGEVRTSVSSKLDYLIVGSEAGSKLEKAKEVGVNIITLEEFREIV